MLILDIDKFMGDFGLGRLDDLYSYVVASVLLDFAPLTTRQMHYISYIRQRTQHVGTEEL